MTKGDADAWVYFITEKLGLPYTKKQVFNIAVNGSAADVWNTFIASKTEYLDLAKFNRIFTPEDVEQYFRAIGYAGMRATFPAKSRGRGVLGPRVVSLKRFKELERIAEWEKVKYSMKLSQAPGIFDLLGRTIIHSADNGIEYGKGVVIDYDDEKGLIKVNFDDGTTRKLKYKYCLDQGYIIFVQEQES